METYKLADAYAMHLLHPDAFSIPEKDKLQELKKGAHVQICFLPIRSAHIGGVGGERMWIRIDAIDGANIAGTLDNDPAIFTHLRCGQEIKFQHRHIYKIFSE